MRVFSGIRPTGSIHLGNYFGAIRQWVELQATFQEALFCIVDLHALTEGEELQGLANHTRTAIAAYLAAGIDPQKCIIFAQSHVSAHVELSWILGCLTPLGWLNRMTQFKEKAGKNHEHVCLGLYAYPILMAADILIYKATHVPVGEDQKQHLELARDLAGVFNRRFQMDYFPLPEPLVKGVATRVMSLRDGRSKMSKSDPSDYSRLNLMDSSDAIALKIRKARTDSDPLPETVQALEKRPEALNLVTIYAALVNKTPEEICTEFAGYCFSSFKLSLTEVAIAVLEPIRQEMKRLLLDPEELDKLLKQGAQAANTLAQPHLREIRHIVGFLNP